MPYPSIKTMNISNADYHADPAISASHLKAVMQSPYHYWSRFINPNRDPIIPTAAMRFGTLVHCAVLEPHELLQRYAVAPDRRTKAGKDIADRMATDGIEAISENDMALALSMAASVREHPYAASLLANGKAEQSYWWDDIATGLRCKCRTDWINDDIIVDLKTCIDASPAGFARAIAQWNYHLQANHYLAGTLAKRFIFIAVEKTAPYAVGIYELDAEALVHGGILRHTHLQRIQDCQAINEWPGYTSTIEMLSLPGWALNNAYSTITSEDF
jgi:exodeoxyribonuclease VIII